MSDVKMNAKEKRKQRRLLERQENERIVTQEKTTIKAEPQEEIVKTSEKEQTKPSLNAKERRKLKRMMEKTKSNSEEGVSEKQEEDKNMTAKQRRLAKRALKRKLETGENTVDNKRPKTKENKEENEGKSIHLTLFLGQLPYSATVQKIRKHFAESGEIKIRMRTDKVTKKFLGTAFIEVKDSSALGAALSKHHTLMDGRRINVEMTATGGGNKSELRRQRIKGHREKQKSVQVEKIKAYLDKLAASPDNNLIPDDIDDRLIDFLSWFDYETAKLALEEFDRCVCDRVRNRKAFMMGILKRFRPTDGVEEDYRPKKSLRRNQNNAR